LPVAYQLNNRLVSFGFVSSQHPTNTTHIDPIGDESPTQGLASPIELDPPDEGALDLGSALEEALNTALSHEGSQRTASPVTPEE